MSLKSTREIRITYQLHTSSLVFRCHNTISIAVKVSIISHGHTSYQLDYELEISTMLLLMEPKAESTIASKKSRASNLIVLVEFLLKFK